MKYNMLWILTVAGCGDGVMLGSSLVDDEMFLQAESQFCSDEQPTTIEVGESPVFVLSGVYGDREDGDEITYDFNPSYADVDDGVLSVDCSKNGDPRADDVDYSTYFMAFIGVGKDYKKSGIVGGRSSGLELMQFECSTYNYGSGIYWEKNEDGSAYVSDLEIPNGDYLFLPGFDGTLETEEWVSQWVNPEGVKVEDGFIHISTEQPFTENAEDVVHSWCEGSSYLISKPFPEDVNVWDGE